MDAPAYSVVTTAHFDRLLKKLAPKHSDLVERFEEAIGILSLDPHNKSHKYPIKKLTNVRAGEGKYRLRSGRFRSATTLRSVKWCCCIVGCGGRIRIEWTPNVRSGDWPIRLRCLAHTAHE
jgi:mRNA-degrading endonuclease RelE of RelBE toxin-antitoxin system